MLISKLQSFVQFFIRVTNEELSQATARLVFSFIIAIYVLFGMDSNPATILSAYTFMQFYLVYSILH